MGQVLHGCATTTHAVRTAIQRSKAPLKELAARKAALTGGRPRTNPRPEQLSEGRAWLTKEASSPFGRVHSYERGKAVAARMGPSSRRRCARCRDVARSAPNRETG